MSDGNFVYDSVRDAHFHQDYLDRLPDPDTGIARREETFPHHGANVVPQDSSSQPRPSELSHIARLCQPSFDRATVLPVSRWVGQVYLERMKISNVPFNQAHQLKPDMPDLYSTGSTSLYEGLNAPWTRTFEVLPAKTSDGDGLPRSVNPAYFDMTGIVDMSARARTMQHVKVVNTHGDARNFG
jgi:hypothetical protein